MLTQTEADTLIVMPKQFVDETMVTLPPGADQTRELWGDDKRELFLLDLWRGTMRLSKVRYQNRARKAIVLLRVEINGAPHTNPDGTRMDGNHIHIYQEGYEAKWAFPLDPQIFTNPEDMGALFEDFCQYCHVQNIPAFQGVML
jgi:hypothetical protein